MKKLSPAQSELLADMRGGVHVRRLGNYLAWSAYRSDSDRACTAMIEALRSKGMVMLVKGEYIPVPTEAGK